MKKFLLILFLFFVLSKPAFADEPVITIPPTPIATSAAPTPVGYTLPYPGLLPGNPLYPVKILRDKIIEFFITDAIKKSEFYLLESDKHLNAGVTLLQMGEYSEAADVVLKGDNYLYMSYGKAQSARQASEPTDEVIDNINLSTMKHIEVLKSMISKSPNPSKKSFENELKRVEELQNMVNAFKKSK